MPRFGPLTTLAAATTVAAAIALPAAAQAAPAPVTTVHGGTQLAAAGGDVAWSQYDAATRRWALVVSRDGAAAVPVGVPTSPRPLDLDLGTTRDGSIVAVYSRCASSAEGGDDCDLYSVSMDPGAAETKLTNLSSPNADEEDPTISDGEVAYVRNERVRGAVGTTLRIGRTSDGAPDGRVIASSTAREGRISAPELGASRVAYVVSSTRGNTFGTQSVHERHLDGSGVRNVYEARSGGANFAGITTVTLLSGTQDDFVFGRTNKGSGKGNRILRFSATTGGLSQMTGNANFSSLGSSTHGLFAVQDYYQGQDALSAVLDLGTPTFTAGVRR